MKPNILFITADQWRGDCLGIAGHPTLKTPHVDRLAADGACFRRHFASAAPCSPARAALYTGLYQMNNRVCRNGTPLDDRFDNVARAARRAGYEPTLFGYTDTALDPRLLHPADPRRATYESVLPGFSVRQPLPEDDRPWLAWLAGRGHDVSDPARIHRPSDRNAPEISRAPPAYTANKTQTAFLTDAFLRWLGEQDAGRPWFAHVSFLRPHPPFIVPEPYNEMYGCDDVPDIARLPSREAEAAAHPFVAYTLDRLKKSDFIPGATGLVRDWSEAEQRTIRAIYYGMISEVDSQLGRIWQGLEAAGAWDDTAIVFTSDHAEMMGDHWLFGKGGFFDGAYHVPLVIHCPGMARSSEIDAFSEAVDIFPTILDLMGVDPATVPDGRSLLPLARGGEASRPRDHVFWEFDFRDVVNRGAERHFGLASSLCNLSVFRSERFKYVHFAGLPPLLFDLAEDPHETRNRAADPDYRDVRLDCAERLLSIRAGHLDQTLASISLVDG
ncbi:MAG: alkaline phosphatase family protein [Bauldia sp.]|nr:alkaline phosphatase family protein [Bauldia sp.]